MFDNSTKLLCPHCGQQLNPDEKNIGSFDRSKGWTPDIVEQAARETGLNVYVGTVQAGHDPIKWLGLWRKDERDLSQFWDRAKELREAHLAS